MSRKTCCSSRWWITIGPSCIFYRSVSHAICPPHSPSNDSTSEPHPGSKHDRTAVKHIPSFRCFYPSAIPPLYCILSLNAFALGYNVRADDVPLRFFLMRLSSPPCFSCCGICPIPPVTIAEVIAAVVVVVVDDDDPDLLRPLLLLRRRPPLVAVFSCRG